MDVNFVIFDPESVTVRYVLGLQLARLYVNTSNSLVSSSPITYNIVLSAHVLYDDQFSQSFL